MGGEQTTPTQPSPRDFSVAISVSAMRRERFQKRMSAKPFVMEQLEALKKVKAR